MNVNLKGQRMGHTPGPWTVLDEGYERCGIFDGSNCQIAKVNIGHQEANARLIAAAPELLNTLK